MGPEIKDIKQGDKPVEINKEKTAYS